MTAATSTAPAGSGRRADLAAALRTWLPVVVALVVIAWLVWLPFSRTWRGPVSPLDEGMSLVYPDLLLEGKLPVADYDSPFPPGTYSATAVAFLVGGARVAAERAAGFAFDLLVLVAVALLLRPRGRDAVLIGTVAMALLRVRGGSNLFPFAAGSTALLLTAGAIVTATTATTERGTRLWAVLGGAAAGFTVASRVDMTLAIAVLAAFVWIDLPRLRARFALGAAVGALPLLAQLVAAGPVLLVRKLLYEPAFVWGQYRRKPYFGVDGEIWWRFGMATVAVLAVVLWGVHVVRTRRGSDRVGRVAIAVVVLPALPYAWQRFDVGHTATALVLALTALLVVAVDVLRERGAPPARAAVGAVVLVALLLVPTSIDNGIIGALGMPRPIASGSPVVTGEPGRSLYVRDRVAEPIQTISDELLARAEPGERLVVGVTEPRQVFLVDTYLYFLFPSLEPGTYYLEFNPGVVNAADSDYADDLRRADWVILNSDYDNVAEADKQPLGPIEPVEVVDELFCEVASAGNFQLLDRCR